MVKGFIHPSLGEGNAAPGSASPKHDADAPLPSLNMADLRLSQKEVAHAFHLPLSELVSAPRLHRFCMISPLDRQDRRRSLSTMTAQKRTRTGSSA